jgi:uncharacterized protein (TIGR02246 family)
MNKDAFKSWLDGYRRAWETRDPQAAADLFTEDATYRETPFTEPERGRPAIQEYWREATSSQDQIQFGYEILSVTGDQGIARWWVSMNTVPSETAFKMDGIFLVRMADGTRCQEFMEWWHRQAG